jgi:CRP/FNR family transcriptional regulator
LIATHPLLRRDRIAAPVAPATADVVPLRRPACLRQQVGRGETLCGAGELFRVLYVVRTGTLKGFLVSHTGLIQVTGFHIAGDMIGLDGIGTGHYHSAVVALEDAEVFVLPFAQYEQWSQDFEYSQRSMMRTLAQEIVRNRDHLLVLGAMRAEQRVALFLLDISLRYGHLGYSRSQFLLRMTRQDIGSYLGLTLETVSRLLSRFQREGVIQVQGKSLALLDFSALWRIAGVSSTSRSPMLDPVVDRTGNFLVPN